METKEEKIKGLKQRLSGSTKKEQKEINKRIERLRRL